MSNRAYLPVRPTEDVEGYYLLSWNDGTADVTLVALPYMPNTSGLPGDPYDNVVDGDPVNLVEETKLALEARLGITVDVNRVIWPSQFTPIIF